MVERFFGKWENENDVFESFKVPLEQRDNIHILFATYDYSNWDGSAFVLFEDMTSGVLFEVEGHHCSCYGLEGEWRPEKASVPELRHRLENGFTLFNWENWKSSLEVILDIYESLPFDQIPNEWDN